MKFAVLSKGFRPFPHTLCPLSSTQHLFLGNMAQGQSMQSIENKLLRAPIYRHRPNPRDFLIIRNKHKFFIREIVCAGVWGVMRESSALPCFVIAIALCGRDRMRWFVLCARTALLL